MSTVIDQDGNVQQWTAVYWRYMVKSEHVAETFAEAYRFLAAGEDYGNLSSEAILGPDGAVLMDREAIWNAQCKDLDPDDLLVQLRTACEIGGVS